MDQPAALWSRCLEYASLTDVGLRRSNNQDSYAVALAGSQEDFDHRGHLFLVADGMGAHAAGELASKIATDLIPLAYHKLVEQSPPEAILSAVLDANNQIHTRGQASPDFHGMGTTACGLLLLPAGAFVVHVGDSRAYRLRSNHIEQLTFDHSLVWEMRASGQLAEGAANNIPKNIITRSLGPSAKVKVDLEGPHPLQVGDTFLLCSDGLSGQVKDDEIGAVLAALPPAEAAQTLIDLACLRGGPDNITVIVVRVLGPQVAEASQQTAAGLTTSARRHKPVHPLLWTLLGVAALATAGLLGLGHVGLAFLTLGATFVVALAALVQRYSGREDTTDNRHFGRGPYVSTECVPNEDLLRRFAEIARQLRDAAVAEKWSVDRSGFDRLLGNSAKAAEEGNLGSAVRDHLRAISIMMAQLRQQAAGDSNVLPK